MPGDPDTRLLALADGLRHANERIDALAGAVGELSGALAAAAANQPRRAVWWPSLGPDERAAAWSDFLGWLDEVLLGRHGELRRVLLACWYQHPGVVDELTVLQVTWHNAYMNPRAAPTAAAEWHDRWLPGARKRIEDDLKECRRQHVDRADREARGAPAVPTAAEDRLAWPGGIPAGVP